MQKDAPRHLKQATCQGEYTDVWHDRSPLSDLYVYKSETSPTGEDLTTVGMDRHVADAFRWAQGGKTFGLRPKGP